MQHDVFGSLSRSVGLTVRGPMMPLRRRWRDSRRAVFIAVVLTGVPAPVQAGSDDQLASAASVNISVSVAPRYRLAQATITKMAAFGNGATATQWCIAINGVARMPVRIELRSATDPPLLAGRILEPSPETMVALLPRCLTSKTRPLPAWNDEAGDSRPVRLAIISSE